MRASDTSTNFWVANPTMLERLERNVRRDWINRNLGSVSRLFLSDVLFFEVERRWCELDNIVGSMAIIEKVYERDKRWRRHIRLYYNNSFVRLLDLVEPCARSLKRPLLVLKGGGAMSTFGIVIVLCLVLAFIELHRWDEPTLGLRLSANKENRAVLIS